MPMCRATRRRRRTRRDREIVLLPVTEGLNVESPVEAEEELTATLEIVVVEGGVVVIAVVEQRRVRACAGQVAPLICALQVCGQVEVDVSIVTVHVQGLLFMGAT